MSGTFTEKGVQAGAKRYGWEDALAAIPRHNELNCEHFNPLKISWVSGGHRDGRAIIPTRVYIGDKDLDKIYMCVGGGVKIKIFFLEDYNEITSAALKQVRFCPAFSHLYGDYEDPTGLAFRAKLRAYACFTIRNHTLATGTKPPMNMYLTFLEDFRKACRAYMKANKSQDNGLGPTPKLEDATSHNAKSESELEDELLRSGFGLSSIVKYPDDKPYNYKALDCSIRCGGLDSSGLQPSHKLQLGFCSQPGDLPTHPPITNMNKKRCTEDSHDSMSQHPNKKKIFKSETEVEELRRKLQGAEDTVREKTKMLEEEETKCIVATSELKNLKCTHDELILTKENMKKKHEADMSALREQADQQNKAIKAELRAERAKNDRLTADNNAYKLYAEAMRQFNKAHPLPTSSAS